MNIKKPLDYVEEAREKLEGVKDIRLAEVLGISRGCIADILKGKRPIPLIACFRLAEILNIEPSEIIAAIQLEAETSEARKDYWKGVFFRHAKVAAVAFCIYGASTMSGQSTAYAGGAMKESSKNNDVIVNYANSRRQRNKLRKIGENLLRAWQAGMNRNRVAGHWRGLFQLAYRLVA